MRKSFLGVLSFAVAALTSLAQPVSGPLVSTNRGVPVFTQTNGKKIDPSPVYIDAQGNLYFGGPGTVIVNDMTTAERNALSATNGMVIYNTSDAKLQVRENGTWVDLVTGGVGGGVFFSTFDTNWFRTNSGVVRPAIGKTLPSWINVTDVQYGADPTGVTNSGAAIQAAINVAQTNSRPPVVYIPTGVYWITNSLTITNSKVTLSGDGNLKTTIRGTRSGMGRVIYVNNANARLFNVHIERLAVEGTNGLASPPNGIEFANCSEVSINDIYGTKLNHGLVIDGVEIAHASHFTFAYNNVGIYQTAQATNGFAYGNLHATFFHLYQCTNAGVRIDEDISNSSYTHGWIENSLAGFELSNRATKDAELDEISIANVQYQNIAGQGFDGGRFISATATGVTNYFIVQNLTVEKARSVTPGASNAIVFLKGSNTNANTAFHDISIRRTMFFDMTVGAIYSDTASTDGEIQQLWVGSLPELTGQGTWFPEVHPGAMLIRNTNNVAEPLVARTGGNDIQYYSFTTNGALGFFVFDTGKSVYWDIGANGNDMSLSANTLTVQGGGIFTNYLRTVDGKFTNSVSFGPNVDNTFYETGGLALWQVAGKPFYFYDALRGNTTAILNTDRSATFLGAVGVSSNLTAESVTSSNSVTLNGNNLWAMTPGANVTFSTNTGTKVMTINSSGGGGGGSGSGTLQNGIVIGSGANYSILTNYALVDFGGGDPSLTLPAAGRYLLTATLSGYSPNTFQKDFKFRDTTAGVDASTNDIAVNISSGTYGLAVHAVYEAPTNSTIQLWSRMNDPAYAGVHEVISTNTTFSYVRLDGVLGFNVNGAAVSTPNLRTVAATGTIPSATPSVSGTNVDLTIGPASATEAGVVTTGTQSFDGPKTFLDSVNIANVLSANSVVVSNLSGSLPVQSDGSDGLISEAINLGSGDVTGVLAIGNMASGYPWASVGTGTNSALMAGSFKNTVTELSDIETLSGATPTIDWNTQPHKFLVAATNITFGEANRPASAVVGESLMLDITNSVATDCLVSLPAGWVDETLIGFTNLVAGKSVTIVARWVGSGVKYYWRTYEFPYYTVVTGAFTLATTDHGKLFNNLGASSLTTYTLPAADAGLSFEFVVADTDGIKVLASGNDTIRIGASVTVNAGSITNSVIGGTLKVTAINSTNYYGVWSTGTWNF